MRGRTLQHTVTGLLVVVGLGVGSIPSARAATRPAPTMSSPEVVAIAKDLNITPKDALSRVTLQYEAGDIVTTLQGALGADYAGVWFDVKAGRFGIGQLAGVDVTDAMAKAGVSDAVSAATDAVPVRSSWTDLLEAQSRWNARLASTLEPGDYVTSLDADSNSVGVMLSSTVKTADRSVLMSSAKVDRVRVEIGRDSKQSLSVPATACSFPNCERPLRGGVSITSAYGTCTAGFLTFSNSSLTPYLMTAGHCLIDNPANTSWFATHPASGSQKIGVNCCGYVSGIGDIGLITIPGSSFWATSLSAEAVAWGSNEHYAIYGTTEGYSGLLQCHSGQTTQVQCGYDNAIHTSQSIAYGPPVGTIVVNGLNGNTGCSSPGDSGGPWLNWYYGSGIDVAGYTCPNAQSYYEPASTAASLMNVHLASAG